MDADHTEVAGNLTITACQNCMQISKATLRAHLQNKGQDSAMASDQGFFEVVQHTFAGVSISEEGNLPTESFLDACSDILPFFGERNLYGQTISNT